MHIPVNAVCLAEMSMSMSSPCLKLQIRLSSYWRIEDEFLAQKFITHYPGHLLSTPEAPNHWPRQWCTCTFKDCTHRCCPTSNQVCLVPKTNLFEGVRSGHSKCVSAHRSTWWPLPLNGWIVSEHSQWVSRGDWGITSKVYSSALNIIWHYFAVLALIIANR